MKTAKNIVKGKSPPAQASKFHPSPHPVLDRLGRVLAVGLLLGGLALPLQADDLGDALDAPGLVWTTGGTSGGTPWFVQTTNTHDGVAAAQSGTSTNFWASSWLQTSVTGRVTVVYWWRLSTDPTWSNLPFQTNGTLASYLYNGSISGVEWQPSMVSFAGGSNLLRWTYFVPGAGAPNWQANAAWLDQVLVTNIAGLKPTFLSSPPSAVTASEYAYSPTNLKTMVMGDIPMNYQWQRNGTNLSETFPFYGVTSPSLVVYPRTEAVSGGEYRLVASNEWGMTTSSVCTVSIVPSKPFVHPSVPYDSLIAVGAYYSLSASAYGSPPFRYQWHKNGNPIPGATLSYYSFTSAALADTGGYSVVVTNDYGAATSRVAQVIVSLDSPHIINEPNPSQSEVTPGGYASFYVYAEGPQWLSYQWRKVGAGETVTWNSSLEFNPADPTNSGFYYAVVANNNGAVTSRISVLAVAPATALGLALNTPDLVITNDWWWYPWTVEVDRTNTHDGVCAARSYAIGAWGYTSFSTVVAGPTNVSFWWRISAAPQAYLEISVDGLVSASISGDVAWQQQTLELPAGEHTLTWIYRKEDAGVQGQDAAWVDQFLIGDAPIVGTEITNFTTSGDSPPWYLQTTTTHDGVEAWQSGAIGDNQINSLAATVSGPGTLTFWWQVESEEGYDFLKFSLDGASQTNLSGRVNWQQQFYVLGPGSHELEWAYTKDGGWAEGADAGWVDEVMFTPTPQPPTLEEALNVTNLTFTTGGDAPWWIETTNTHDGVMALQSGAIGDNQQSWLQTTITGPGTLSFWWKVSSEAGCDWLSFSADSSQLVGMSSEQDWAQRTFAFGPGQHLIEWAYAKDGSVSAGMDAVWVDQVVWTPEVPDETLGQAVDVPGQTFTTGGDAPWFFQTTHTFDGRDAAQSGPILDDQRSVMATTITGPAGISFWWKVSAEYGDFLAFFADDSLLAVISDSIYDWSQRTFLFGAGEHRLEWHYIKNGSGSSGWDAGWVDQLTIDPNARPLRILTQPVSLIATQGNTVTFRVVAEGSSLSYQWRLDFMNLEGQTSDTLTLANVQPRQAGRYDVVVANAYATESSTPARLRVDFMDPIALGAFTRCLPEGSWIFTNVTGGSFDLPGDVDTFVSLLDSNQTLTVALLPSGEGIRGRVQVFDPTNGLLAAADAPASGRPVLLQSVPVTVGGQYRIVLTPLEGEGDYVLRVVLNAVLEEESLGLSTNASLATAQTLGAPLALAPRATRWAALGRTDSTDNYYSLTLPAGAYATFSLAQSAVWSSQISLTLLDASGAALALGRPLSGSIGATISGFLAPSSGTYYARVSGLAGLDYALMAVCGADCDSGRNRDAASAQNLLTDTVLGGMRTMILTNEFEPNNDWDFANDLSRALQFVGGTQYRAVITGAIDPAYSGDADYFRFPARPGSSLTVVLDSLGVSAPYLHLVDRNDRRLASVYSWGPGLSTLSLSYNDFDSAGDYFLVARNAGSGGGGYRLTLNLYMTIPFSPIAAPADYYRFTASAGALLTVATLTPAGGPGAFDNPLDPSVQVLDTSGRVLGADDNSAADGRNALLSLTITNAATYLARVASAGPGGEYVLSLTGAGPSAAPFQVVTLTPTNGSRLTAYPTVCRMTFNDSLLLTSVQAEDLRVNDSPAAAVAIIDDATLEFAITNVITGDGTYALSLAAGSLTSIAGRAVQAASATFEVDATAPRVVSSSIAEGAVLPPGVVRVVLGFSEALNTTGLSHHDFALVNEFTANTREADSFAYSSASRTFTATYSKLEEGNYLFSLFSDRGSFRDPFGNLLDGEPSAPLPSGDGTPGGEFKLHFKLDVETNSPATLVAAGPLALQGAAAGSLYGPGDADAFTLSVDAGQFVTVVCRPASGGAAQCGIELLGPGGVLLGSASAPNPGQPALLQTAPTTETGLHTVRLTSLAGAGSYKVEMWVNAAYEQEDAGVADNDTLATAQNLSFGALALPGGASIASVTGGVTNRLTQLSLEGWGNLDSNNTFTVVYASGTWDHPPVTNLVSDVVVMVEPSSDYRKANVALTFDAEGLFSRTLFVPIRNKGIPAQFTIPRAVWLAMAADGTNTFTIRAADPGTNYGQTDVGLTVRYAVTNNADWFTFNLGAGETASLALKALNLQDQVALQLLDAQGGVITAGAGEADEVVQAIHDFVAPAAGAYYVRVSGTGRYLLTLARGTALARTAYFEDFEKTVGVAWQPQTNSATEPLTRFLGPVARDGALLELRVSPGQAYQLRFDLYTLDGWDGSSPVSGPDFFDVFVQSKLLFHHSFNNQGGPQSYPFAPEVSGVNLGWGGGNDAIYRRISVPFVADSSPVRIDFDDNWSSYSYAPDYSWGLDNVSVVPLVGPLGQTAPVQDITAARQVFGQFKGQACEFQFQAKEATALELTTQTLGDAPALPANTFNPQIELLNPQGLWVGGDQDSASDGRNCRLAFAVPADGGGAYRVRVLGTGEGAFVLRVNGTAAATNPAPRVVAATPGDGKILAGPPPWLDLVFSEPLLANSLTATALQVDDGTLVIGCELLGGNVARYSLTAPNRVGTHTYRLPAGAVRGLNGLESPPYAGSFTVDHTGPRIVSQTPAIQASAPFSQLTFTFDEEIDPLSFDNAVRSFIGPDGDLRGRISKMVVLGNQATVYFAAQIKRGLYTMLIVPSVQNTLGWWMDQNQNGIAREDGDAYTAQVGLQSPDLVVQSVSVSGSAVFGGPLNVSWTVANTGNDPAQEAWSDQVYLSSATNLQNYYWLGTFPAGFATPLGAGASYTNSARVVLPRNVTLGPGQYYVVVRTDSQNQQPETDENNNLAASAAFTVIAPPVPDLAVASFPAPSEVIAGQTIQISWVITNQGTADATGTWNDYLNLSPNNNGQYGGYYLGNFAFSGTIPAGQSITRTQPITIPIIRGGTWWLALHTDVHNTVDEFYYETNNTCVSQIRVIEAASPNLRVAFVLAPTNAFSSQQAVIEWGIINTGTGPTSAGRWSDAVYLSADATLDSGDTLLGAVANPSYLNPGESYRNSLTATLPRGIQGLYYYLVVCDSANAVNELGHEDDNLGVAGPLRVTLTPPPDLQVLLVAAPATAFSGQEATVQWIVTNSGVGLTLETGWMDEVYVSRTNRLDATSVALGEFAFPGRLEPGESYRAEHKVKLPEGISGPYYFLVQCNFGNRVYEHVYGQNNLGAETEPTLVNLTPPPDLEVSAVWAPEFALARHTLRVTYRVANNGSTMTPSAHWDDRLYLSADTNLDAQADLVLLQTTHYGKLDIGQSYNGAFSATLPDGLEGTYYAFVVADVTRSVFELDRTNNIARARAPIIIQSQPADLVVTNVVAPLAAQAGAVIPVSWTVRNQGPGDTVTADRIDELWVSTNAVWGLGMPQLLAEVPRQALLAPGAADAITNYLVGLPLSLEPGAYFLFVHADAYFQVYEAEAHTNNISAGAPILLTRATADLEVTQIQILASAQPDRLGTVRWLVRNAGSAATRASSLSDGVFLAQNSQQGAPSLVAVGSWNHALAPGATGTNEVTFELPDALSGDFYVLVCADYSNQELEAEGGGEANNCRWSTGTIHLPDQPDLVVSTIVAQKEAFSGQSLEVSWTLRNQGRGATKRSWWDSVYLSLDQIFDSQDIYLGSAQHADILAAGQTLNHTSAFDLPPGLAGPYYVFVDADVGDSIKEGAGEGNNVNYDHASTLLRLQPPADLAVGFITVPVNATPGRHATITYWVENRGNNTASGAWTDSIYLSTDAQWDINDALFGRVEHRGDVLPNSSYSGTCQGVVPGVLPGDYYVIVRTDILNNLVEEFEDNNIGGSLDAIDLDAEDLALGVASTGQLQRDQAAFYRLQATNGQTLRLRLDAADADAADEIYVRRGQMPTRGQFDWAANAPFTANPELMVPIAETGAYYVMIYRQQAGALPGYSLLAEEQPFRVISLAPAMGGDAGSVTVQILGALFTPQTTFRLMSVSNQTVTASPVWIEHSALAYATFNLQGLATGACAVVALETNTVRAVLTNGFTVVSGAGPSVEVVVDAGLAVVEGWKYPANLVYANLGDADTEPPLLLISSPTGAPLSASAEQLEERMLPFLGLSFDGPADILRPQALQTVPFYFHTPERFAPFAITARAVMAEDSSLLTPAEWDEMREAARPSEIQPVEWYVFWAGLQPRMGASWGDYVRLLYRLSRQYSPPEQPIREVRALWALAYADRANFRPTVQLSGRVVNAPNDQPVAGIEVGAFAEVGGQMRRGGSAVTDEQGRFTIEQLPPGSYEMALQGRDFDQNRDGVTDWQPPALEVLGDVADLLLVARDNTPQPTQISDDQPSLAVDAAGVTHVVWSHENRIWHAYFDQGKWVATGPISRNAGHTPVLRASPRLIDGAHPGLVASWLQGTGNQAEVSTAIGRPKAAGGYEWAEPAPWTNDGVQDSDPALAVDGNGTVLLVVLKADDQVQDDTDLYYRVVAVEGTDLQWKIEPQALRMIKGIIDSEGCKLDIRTVLFEQDWVGIGAKLELAVSGTTYASGCKAKTGLAGLLLGEVKTKDFRFSLQGSGNLEGAWKADKLACDWEFEKATGNFGVQGQIEHRTLLLKILNVLPPPGPVLGSAVGSAVSWINKQPGYAAEAGASVTLGLTITGEWDTKFPYPDYRFPDHVQEAVVNLAVGPYLRAGFTSDIRAKLSGTIGAKARVWPAFHLKEVYGTTRLELKVYWFVLSKDYTISYIDPSGPATARMALGGLENEPFLDGTLRYDPEAALGTTNVYAPGAVLATVAEDRTHDGAPTVQQAADGTLFMAWCKDNDPRLPQIGSQVFVTDLVNDAWTAPVAVPATLGFNSGVQAITDAQGQRLLVWAHADSSAITPAATLEQLNAVREASALVYSVHDGVAWSAPQPICPGQGAGGDVALGANDAGEVVLCWVRRLETNRVALLSSRWNGSAWSVLEPVAQAPEITHPSLAAQDSAMVVCWAQGDQPGAQVNPRRVFSSTRTSAWSAPALFAPENLVDFPIAASPAPASVRRKDMSWGCRPAVPDDCCDCRTGVKEIRMGSGACVQKTVYSPNCIKYVYYKPCVIAPMDPNDIQGPPGYGLEQWVAVSDPLRYTIRFENDAAVATAPAREVRIVQNLDPALDPRAFRVGSFGFGDLVFNVPDNRAFYTTRLDLRETRGIYLDISAGVDVAAGQAFWSFVSIDPATGDQPLDPYKGFLPPNVLKPEGQGFVSYAIRPRADAATGTRILALATIIFDTQPPIDTPLIFNTLETGGPVSAVAPLPEVVTNSTFAVSWAGADEEGGSGVNAYTIYASDNGGAYRVWLNDTTLTSALFTGQPDHQYAFYSRARDNAGNLEDARETPDARTILRLPNTPPVFEPQPEFFLFFGQTLLLTNRAVDLDLRADRLTFTLGAGSPTNAVLDPVTGVLRWTPGRRAAGCTNLLAVLVTDDGLPPLSATQMLSVVVARDLRIELGSAVVAAGQSGSVSVNLSSLAPVSHLGFTLTCVPAALTNLSLQAANPALVNAALEPLGAGTYRLRLDSELSLAETSPVAYLGFSAVSNQSALVSLLVGEPAALQPGGMAVPRIVPLNGQVAVVGGAPLLSISLAAHAPPVLILYGTPATQYVIQTAPDLAAASWTTYWSGSLTNQFQRLTLSPTNRTMFFRAYH